MGYLALQGHPEALERDLILGDGGYIEFIIDSGATVTMVNQVVLLQSATPIDEPLNVYKRNGGVRAKAKGTISIRSTNSYGHVNEITLTALYVPDAPANLISQSQLDLLGYTVITGNAQCVIRDSRKNEIWRCSLNDRRLYTCKVKSPI